MKNFTQKPPWIKTRFPGGAGYARRQKVIGSSNLHSICREGACPNIGECWQAGHVTFLILGNQCTRHCRFCNVDAQKPKPVDESEPEKIAAALKDFQCTYTVITSVTRDDLPDGGAQQFVKTVQAVKKAVPNLIIELLIPDFCEKPDALKTIADSGAEVIGHNIETVSRLYPEARPEADYALSLDVLQNVKGLNPQIIVKSGIMVGMGESEEEIQKTLIDIYDAGAEIIHIGQYLQPSEKHHPVIKYYHPEEFASLANMAKEIGFKGVQSGPLVRSSYHAMQSYLAAKNQ